MSAAIDNHDNVHDHGVYASSVDYAHRRVTLHTVCPEGGAEQYIDVVFNDVVACHLEQQHFGDDFHNVLFRVDETDATFVLKQHAELLARTKNYGWPIMSGYKDFEDLARQLAARGARAYEVHGTIGVSGFVFAGSMALIVRPSRHQG